MPRIFACLAIANSLLLAAAGAFGLLAQRLNVDRHVLLAVLAMSMSCLVQVVAFTYLTVTGKMIGQAVHLAGLDRSIVGHVKRLKCSLTFCLPAVFLPLVVVTATGAPVWRSGGDATIHYIVAGGAAAAHLWAFWREYGLIVENSNLLRRTLDAYSAFRSRRKAGSKPPPP